ncbi:MAG: hypothetical protein ACTS73_02570 [Arsenophonus sp. NEOnobi-MAG3]
MNLKRHDIISIDLVAICVNVLIVKSTEPFSLLLRNKPATGKLEINIATSMIN